MSPASFLGRARGLRLHHSISDIHIVTVGRFHLYAYVRIYTLNIYALYCMLCVSVYTYTHR